MILVHQSVWIKSHMLLVHFSIAGDQCLSDYFEDSTVQVSKCYDKQRYEAEWQITSVTVFF